MYGHNSGVEGFYPHPLLKLGKGSIIPVYSWTGIAASLFLFCIVFVLVEKKEIPGTGTHHWVRHRHTI